MTNLWQKIVDSAEKSAEYSLPNMHIIGAAATIGCPFFYIVWAIWFPENYENMPLRLIGSLLFFPLIFVHRWPFFLFRFLPLYWFIAVLYITGFFFPFMLLKNDFSITWSMSTAAGVALIVFVSYDWIMSSILYVTGLVIAWLAFWLEGNDITYHHIVTYLSQSPVYLYLIVFGGIFNHAKVVEKLKQEQLDVASSLGRSIAHELRTPLLSINLASSSLGQFLPTIVDQYKKHESDDDESSIREFHLNSVIDAPSNIANQATSANMIIDMLLVNSKSAEINKRELDKLSLNHCMNQALEEFPFNPPSDRELVNWTSLENDFYFYGNNSLFKHVLFNLLKNAIHSIKACNRGKIEITYSSDALINKIHFKDTGDGIRKEHIKKIFEPFFTKGKGEAGTGIGLYFCRQVMESMKGEISCKSELGKYCEFTLHFPKITSN